MNLTRTLTVVALIALAVLNYETANAEIPPISELNREPSTPGSHFGETSRSTLELDYRSKVILGKDVLGWKNMHYPRIKQLDDGTFIMLYQAARISKNVFCSHSKDGISWTPSGKVFSQKETINGYGSKDLICYSSADCLVLKNGDILAFSPFRTEKGYRMIPEDNGIAMVRSRDKGHTWEDYKVIFVGQTWEPYAMELESGEIQVYFTDSDPEFKGSSAGVSLLRSFDGGHTWVQQCYISRHYKGMALDQKNNRMSEAYSDQMPSVCVLGDGKTKFLAMESVEYVDDDTSKEKTYTLSFVWNSDDWKETLRADQTGPSWKVDHAFNGCAPYTGYFPSGETILSYNRKMMCFRVGNERADNFIEVPVYHPFGQAEGYWGSFEILDDHSLFAAIPYNYDADRKYHKIALARLYLNHMIEVKRLTPVIDGSGLDWETDTDALFIGSEGQAQCTFRFAQDRKNVYVNVGLLDKNMSEGDMVNIMFADENSTGSPVELSLSYDNSSGAISAIRNVKSAVKYYKGEGIVAEIAIPKKKLSLSGGRTGFCAELIKKNENYTDGFTNMLKENPGTWIPLVFQK